MSTPKCRLNRSPISAGSASPADETRRSAMSSRAGRPKRGEHAGESGRRAVEDGRLDAADAPSPALEHRVRGRPLGHQQDRRADREGEAQRIAEAIGEEQLGGREADVVLAEAEDRLAVKLRRPIGVGVRMDRPLGAAGRAGRIEPEGGIVGVGPGRTREGRLPVEEGLELRLAEFERLRGARYDDLVDLVVGLGQRRFEGGLDRAADDDALRARMFEHVGVVVGGQQGVDRDRNDAGEKRAQKRHRPVGAIEHEEHHPLLAFDAGVLERRGEAARALVEFAVSERAQIVDERDLVRTAGVRLEKMPGEVEHLRRRCDAGAHRRLFPVGRSF